jgi:hypothetical protein
MNNLNTMVEIVSGLRFLPIAQLKHVWDVRAHDTTHTTARARAHAHTRHWLTMVGAQEVPSKHMLRLSKLSKLLGGNYEQIQARLRDVEPPCIPFVGAYLHEVAYIWDSYPAFVTTEIVRL